MSQFTSAEALEPALVLKKHSNLRQTLRISISEMEAGLPWGYRAGNALQVVLDNLKRGRN